MTPAETGGDVGVGEQLQCVVVTPETTVLDTTAQFVALPLFDGEIGVAPLHSPMIGRLGFGEMRVVQQTGTRAYYVDGGFLQVADNRVTVLTGRALPADQIDADAVATQLATWQARPARGAQQMAVRDRHVNQARAQQRVSRRAQSG